MTGEGNIDKLTRQLEESKQRIDLIRTVTLELNAISSLTVKLNNILKILHDRFGINHSMMVLPDKQLKKLVIKASYGYGNKKHDDTLDLSTGIIGIAARSRKPLNITGLRQKKQYIRAVSAGKAGIDQPSPGLENPESQIAIPLVSNDELVAVLMAESYNASVFSRDDENFLILLSQSIAVSIQNAMLFDNMEEMIAERTEALQKSNQTKDQLFSIISHDLRGPVASFHNISKLIHHYNKQDEKDKIDILFSRIDRSVGRLNHLLDNLLHWALTQRNEIRCQCQEIDIVQLINEVAAIYEEFTLTKNLTVSVSAPETVMISGDYNTLSAVFRNIFNNALKYTPRNGSVKIEVSPVNDNILITFTDTGIGISPQRLSSIFELSETRSTQGTENEKGTGLGLLVAKEFVQLNKGQISISSSPGQGTVVSVVLPAAP
ncbi:MAG TPA: GAF domain-containing sensor histidine kinase [Chitinophagaceae bacterium]